LKFKLNVIIFSLTLALIVGLAISILRNTQYEYNEIFEAEDAKLSGVEVNNKIKNYSGEGYVTKFNKSDDNIVFRVNVPRDGIYNINIRYSIPKISGEKYTLINVNGSYLRKMALPALNTFQEISVGNFSLKKGENSIMLISEWGFYNIDYIRVQGFPVKNKPTINDKLVNEKATNEAKNLMKFLVSIQKSHILSGQQGLKEAEWVDEHVGKKPAVVGFDFMDYSLSRVRRGVKSNETEEAIKWHQEGGIVSFSWHWNAPKDLINEPGKEWSEGFRTKATTFDIQYALSHPTSEDYQLLLKDIDAIAIQLKKLEQANVPVLFRPLHEAEGGWFWWGAKGPEPAKELYRLIYDRITNYHKINNIIWVWNSSAKEWYPGNKYVDIVSYDSYPDAGDYRPLIGKYAELTSLVHNKKLVALSENGPIPDPNLLKEYQVNWSWFLTWQDKFLKDGKTNSLEHLSDVYNNDYVITLDKLQKYKIYSSK